jgi:glycosyltransferase involved in cell wall biosynthesis
MAQLIQDLKPDLCHLHNIYQDISPSVLTAIKARNIPSVVTLHDYKLICPNYNMTHDGKVCEDCRDGRYYKCMTNRCKQGSYLYSVVPTLEAYVHRALNIWKQNVDCFISPSNFLKNKMVEFGWAESRIEVIQIFCLWKSMHRIMRRVMISISRTSFCREGAADIVTGFQSLPSHSRLTIVGGGPLEGHLKQWLQVISGLYLQAI